MPLTKDLGNYLGHPILHGGRSHKVHEKVLKKLHDRLEGWKSKVLSRAGQIVLAKTVINTIPVFFMQLESFPTKVHKEIDKIVRKCVWGEMRNSKKLQAVS